MSLVKRLRVIAILTIALNLGKLASKEAPITEHLCITDGALLFV